MGKIASLWAEIGADTTKLKSGLNDVKDDLKKTGAQMKGLENGAKEAGKSTASLGSRFSALKSAILPVTAAVVGAGVALKTAFDLGKQGAQLEYTADKFDRLAASIGTTGAALRKDLGAATKGMLSDFEAMGAAADMMALGLAKTHDEAIRLTRVASALGMDMNQLVLTLTNKTTMRFDALGVSVDGFAQRVKSLEAAGMSADKAFSEAFLQQAEEQIERIGDVADSSAGSFKRLEASVKNFGDSLKLQAVPFAKDAASALVNLFERVNTAKTAYQLYDDAVQSGVLRGRQQKDILWQINSGFESQITVIDTLTGLMMPLTQETARWAEGQERANLAVAASIPIITGSAAEMSGLSNENRVAALVIDEQLQKTELLSKAMQEQTRIMGESKVATVDMVINYSQRKNDIDIFGTAIESLRQRIIETGDTSGEMTQELIEMSQASGDATARGVEFGLQASILEAALDSGVIPLKSQTEALTAWDSVVKTGKGSLDEILQTYGMFGNSQIDTAEKLALVKEQLSVFDAEGMKPTIETMTKAATETMPKLEGAFGTIDERIINMTKNVGNLNGAISRLPTHKRIDIDVYIHVHGEIPGGGDVFYTPRTESKPGTSGGGLAASLEKYGVRTWASGGSFIVPPGFPNDSYPALLTSGEKVDVTPAQHSAYSGGSGNSDVVAAINALRRELPRSVRDAVLMVSG